MATITEMIEDLRYPIGDFERHSEISSELRGEFINTIENLPQKLREAVEGLSEEQLETPYRPEGWTVRQTVHHVADSHLNMFIRLRLGLTEEKPTIKPYAEDEWAKLYDSKMPLDVSFKIIEGVHARLTVMLKSLTDEQFKRKLIHPDSGEWTVEGMLGLYDWHSKHHTAHITRLRERKNW
ncbi:MAG TPA: bacillithiol transferase BstA [Pyrinomonadaceae bacterium]|nr:bacillithiol transferase BstA [Pyrinomonadaceae bacterium]